MHDNKLGHDAAVFPVTQVMGTTNGYHAQRMRSRPHSQMKSSVGTGIMPGGYGEEGNGVLDTIDPDVPKGLEATNCRYEYVDRRKSRLATIDS